MLGVFRTSLLREISARDAEGQIELVADGERADVVVKVPPQHLMQDKAARYVKVWLARALK